MPFLLLIGLLWQHVITSDQRVLQHAIEQLNKIPLKEQRGTQERSLLKSLHSKVEGELGPRDMSFLQSFLLPIQKWADKQLGDYHLNFAEVTIESHTLNVGLWSTILLICFASVSKLSLAHLLYLFTHWMLFKLSEISM